MIRGLAPTTYAYHGSVVYLNGQLHGQRLTHQNKRPSGLAFDWQDDQTVVNGVVSLTVAGVQVLVVLPGSLLPLPEVA